MPPRATTWVLPACHHHCPACNHRFCHRLCHVATCAHPACPILTCLLTTCLPGTLWILPLVSTVALDMPFVAGHARDAHRHAYCCADYHTAYCYATAHTLVAHRVHSYCCCALRFWICICNTVPHLRLPLLVGLRAFHLQRPYCRFRTAHCYTRTPRTLPPIFFRLGSCLNTPRRAFRTILVTVTLTRITR